MKTAYKPVVKLAAAAAAAFDAVLEKDKKIGRGEV